jgi:hypothetical protein
MTFDPSATIVRTSEAIATEIDGEIVLIHIEDGKYFGLDPVGSEIWRRLETPKRVDALCDELKAHFEGDPNMIEREALAFLDQLSESRLLLAA